MNPRTHPANALCIACRFWCPIPGRETKDGRTLGNCRREPDRYRDPWLTPQDDYCWAFDRPRDPAPGE